MLKYLKITNKFYKTTHLRLIIIKFPYKWYRDMFGHWDIQLIPRLVTPAISSSGARLRAGRRRFSLRARYVGAPVCMRTRISSFLHRRSLAKRLSLPRATNFRQESSPTAERGGRSCTLNPDQFSQVIQPIYRHDPGRP